MTEIQQIVLTASLSILGGVLVYSISNLFINLLNKPLSKQKMLLAQLCCELIEFAYMYDVYQKSSSNNNKWNRELSLFSDNLKKLAIQLNASQIEIPFYSLLAMLRLTVAKKQLSVVLNKTLTLSSNINFFLDTKNESWHKKANEHDFFVRQFEQSQEILQHLGIKQPLNVYGEYDEYSEFSIFARIKNWLLKFSFKVDQV